MDFLSFRGAPARVGTLVEPTDAAGRYGHAIDTARLPLGSSRRPTVGLAWVFSFEAQPARGSRGGSPTGFAGRGSGGSPRDPSARFLRSATCDLSLQPLRASPLRVC